MAFGGLTAVVGIMADGVGLAKAAYQILRRGLALLLRRRLVPKEIREVSAEWPPTSLPKKLPRARRRYCYVGVAPFPGREELVELCRQCEATGVQARVLLADPDDKGLLLGHAELCERREEGVGQRLAERLRQGIAHTGAELGGCRHVELRYHGEALRYSCHILDSDQVIVAVHVEGPEPSGTRSVVIRRARRGTLLEDCRNDFERLWRGAVPARLEARGLAEVVSRETDTGRRARVLQRFCREQVEANLESLGDFLTGAECLGHRSPEVWEASVELVVSGMARFGRSTGKLLKELVGVLPRVSEERRTEALEQAATPDVVASLRDWDREQIREVLWRMVKEGKVEGPCLGLVIDLLAKLRPRVTKSELLAAGLA